ncbi:MAG: glycosyltransferase family 4 protein [Chloroflexi bacterium]|nr:glycosyltransferase family 4 protein [Chloroflexota bacterium]
MKIALVSPYDYPYPGGVNEHITHLDRHFRALGHDTRILAASTEDQDELGDHVIKVSGAVAAFPFSGSNVRITYSPRVYRRVKEILDAEKFDVVHVHEPGAPLLSPFVLLQSNSINIGTFHAYRETNPVYGVAKRLIKRGFNRLHGRIFVSEAVRDYITQYFPGEYTLIPNGVDCARFSASHIQPIERFNDGRPNILFVGRLDKRKGFRHLLRAFPIIKQTIPNARLIVAGAFEEKDKAPFVRYARSHKLHGVHFIGYVSPEELPRYFRTGTIFCAPSTGFESFGIVLLEAMAAGVPIVASDIIGYRAVLNDGVEGLLTPPGDERAIANALIELLRDPARRARMSARGKATAAQYDWSIIAQRVLDYYDQVIAAQPSALKIKSAATKRQMARVRRWWTWRPKHAEGATE